MKEEAEKLCKEIRDAGVEAIALTADCKSLDIYVMLSFFASMYFCTMLFHAQDLTCFYYGTQIIVGSKRDEIQAMFKKAIDEFGRVDVLVNNAGIARDGLVVRMKPEQWQQVIDINLSGVYYASEEFLKVGSTAHWFSLQVILVLIHVIHQYLYLSIVCRREKLRLYHQHGICSWSNW